jgi:catechol 2,3-dioxygenase-like lactoylglutathione lyase family enzyme
LCFAQPSSQTGIAHLAFRVADLDATRAFYNKLGFEQFFEAKQGERTTQAFLKVNDHQFIELYPRTESSQPLGLMHICYESSNIESLHAELVQRGVAISDVRKAGAGNLLMTMKDPEDQTIEYTQYMPGSRHFEDRGKHLGDKRVARVMVAATSPARDAEGIRSFYIDKLGFRRVDPGPSTRLRMPGDSGNEVDIPPAGPDGKSGVRFGVADLKRAREGLTSLGLIVTATPRDNPALLTVTDPDGVVVSFVTVAQSGAAVIGSLGTWPPTGFHIRVSRSSGTTGERSRCD